MKFSNENIKVDSIIELLKKCESDNGSFLDSIYNLYFFISLTKSVNDIKKGNNPYTPKNTIFGKIKKQDVWYISLHLIILNLDYFLVQCRQKKIL